MNPVSKTQTVGELLAKKRQANHLTLKEVAEQTFIKLEYLEAIEANQFAQLPGALRPLWVADRKGWD